MQTLDALELYFFLGIYQLRTVEFSPEATGVYYMGVTRVSDDLQEERGEDWGLFSAPVGTREYQRDPDNFFFINHIGFSAQEGSSNASTGHYGTRDQAWYTVGLETSPATGTD